MSKNGSHPIPADSLPPRKSEAERLAVPQERDTPTPRLPQGREDVEEKQYISDGPDRRQGVECEAMMAIEECDEREMEGPVVAEQAKPVRLELGGDKAVMDCKCEEDRFERLESEISAPYEQRRTRHIREREERLKQTEKLLETRSAELSGAQTFLSTTDCLSEVEVLGIVRDLNENIYQVAVNLTDEWEKLELSQTVGEITTNDTISRPRNPTIIRKVPSRDPVGLTILLQSCICSQVVKITASWSHHEDLSMLNSVYQLLSASEGQAVSARWRSLTHRYLPPRQSPHSTLLVEELANVLSETGSFYSAQQSLGLVQAVALHEIETIVRLAQSLESALMVDVTSSDISLIFEAPDTVFDAARMANEFGSDGPSVSGRRDRIAGTTEVGVLKSRSDGVGKRRHVQVLLKAKVVLRKDVVGGEDVAPTEEVGGRHRFWSDSAR